MWFCHNNVCACDLVAKSAIALVNVYSHTRGDCDLWCHPFQIRIEFDETYTKKKMEMVETSHTHKQKQSHKYRVANFFPALPQRFKCDHWSPCFFLAKKSLFNIRYG